jgi:ribosomal protein L19E
VIRVLNIRFTRRHVFEIISYGRMIEEHRKNDESQRRGCGETRGAKGTRITAAANQLTD